MSLRLRLVRGEEVLLEVPLSPEEWSEEELVQELFKAGRDAYRFRNFWMVFSNERRLRMMIHLLRDDDHVMHFKEFQEELGMNPKSIREHAMRLHRCGLLAFPRRGCYRLLHRAGLRFMVLNLAFRRIFRFLTEEYREEWEVGTRGSTTTHTAASSGTEVYGDIDSSPGRRGSRYWRGTGSPWRRSWRE
ncbi:hypothetical protein J7L60_04095 [Candidatus Bathyarchaeota archaeon]|nr:hypothetical protein [Candidatus Bathyarchaeota archaeon]